MTRRLYTACILAILLLGCSTGAKAYTVTSHFTYPIACDSHFYRITASAYTPTLRVMTYFGDGTSRLDTFFSNTPYRAYIPHKFLTSGIFTVKHVLLVSGVPVDSISYSDTVGICRNIHVYSYVDHNSNCILDAGDTYLPNPYSLEVDSSGIPIDTLTGISFHYIVSNSAPTGTIYKFKVIGNPLNYHVTCPSGGYVLDTIGTSNGYNKLGFMCDSSNFDLGVYGWFRGGVTGGCAHVYVHNYRCGPQAATVTLTYSPKYLYNHVYPTSVSVVSSGAGYVTFNLGTVTTNAGCIAYFTPVGTPSLGDTTQTTWTVNPITGDANPANNVLARVDTIHTAYDPNDKAVTPQGNIRPGTLLEYKIGFENLGSDTAFNIHIQDTLSDNLDINTLKLTTTSAEIYQTVYSYAGHNVVKFDLPHVNLLDTTHPGLNSGMIVFTINAKAGLAEGTVITNQAGIYFDANPVVPTNTVFNTIGVPESVSVMSNTANAIAYPNPVHDVLMISSTKGAYTTLELVNALGQEVVRQSLKQTETSVDVRALSPGIYYIILRGDGGGKVLKMQKL